MNSLKKSLLFLSLIFVMAVAFTACKSETDEYYIRYTVGITPGDQVDITYQDIFDTHPTIKGTEKESTVERIIGPVYGGFPAKITATVNGGQAPAFIKIEASLNGAPYQTKAETTGSTTVSWSTPIE